MPDTELRTQHDDELAGIDQLDTPIRALAPRAQALWRSTWPKLAALALFLLMWQLVASSGWKPSYVLPGPGPVFERVAADIGNGKLIDASATTMRRALTGFSVALVVGMLIGLAVSRSERLRAAIGSLITGLETMPSIAWFPLAILLFKLSEQAILFVVVLGAAPAIANGLISGIDHIPRLWLRAGRVMGARGVALYRHVVLPAALPSFLSGLKQGWAFAWRSLLAGELLVIIANRPSLGVNLHLAREVSDARSLMAAMVVILAIGVLVDGLVFGRLERALRARWGLVGR